MLRFLFTSILLSFFISESFALEMLKPSLLTQMEQQESLDKTNYIKNRQSANLSRLAELRAKKSLKVTATKASPQKNTNTYSAPSLSHTPTISKTPSYASHIPGVDMMKIREAWFGWYNDYRSSLGLGIYNHDSRLDATAHDWNIEFARGKGANHHSRSPGDGYYNFSVIDKWFIARGINPKVINRSKHTENVGYGYYRCSQSDCTDELIASIRTTWNFFMSEKGKSYDAHYRSIINPYFTKMGFDIIVVPSENRYYITVHYITE